MDYYANNDYRDYLAHYGILGMHWGIRRFQPYSVHPRKGGEGGKETGEAKKASWSTRRHAKKDAKEYARAKMYYGEGAGTRRKLIKAKVDERSKHEYGYKEEFERQLGRQNMGKHSDAAVRERRTRDAVNTGAKTVRRIIGGPIGVTALTAGYYYAHQKGVDAKIAKYVKNKLNF